MTDTLQTTEQTNCEAEPNWIQCCGYYEKQIREEKDKIAEYEKGIALSHLRLEQLEISLGECQKDESPTQIPDELRSDELVGFWMNKLLANYRNNAGYIGGIGADLISAKLSESQLCHLAAKLISLICNEVQENIKVIDLMSNRNGLLTTPGHIKDSIYYHICKQCGIDLSTKSVKERPDAIRAALGRWDVDNSFQESNRIMRHWAQHGHQQKKEAASVARMPKNRKELKEWVQCERRKRKSEKPGYFIAWLEQQSQFTEFAGKKPSNQTLYSWIRVQ